ncbi:MAG: hypothetical protein HYW71_03475 [Candidatus Niyogibacteria bacterium]|nr:hypothetical protein [Candidatus Niyogibacteria bacterium]
MNTITIPKKLNKEVKNFIVQTIHEVINDSDFKLELNEKVKKRLRQALISKQKTISFSEIKKKYY